MPLFGINVDTEKGTYSSYHYQSAALAGGAYDWASPHAGFCWAPEETPRVRTSPRAKTHQRWNYWVQGRYMISQNKRTKRTPKNTSSEKESKPSSHFQWKDVKNFPTVFLSFALGDVNSMYILRGTLIYVQSVHIYIHIANASVFGSFLSNMILWIHMYLPLWIVMIYTYNMIDMYVDWFAYTLIIQNEIRINFAHCSKTKKDFAWKYSDMNCYIGLNHNFKLWLTKISSMSSIVANLTTMHQCPISQPLSSQHLFFTLHIRPNAH